MLWHVSRQCLSGPSNQSCAQRLVKDDSLWPCVRGRASKFSKPPMLDNSLIKLRAGDTKFGIIVMKTENKNQAIRKVMYLRQEQSNMKEKKFWVRLLEIKKVCLWIVALFFPFAFKI